MPTIIHRDATTGRIVTAAHAKANPETTTREIRTSRQLRRRVAELEAEVQQLRDALRAAQDGTQDANSPRLAVGDTPTSPEAAQARADGSCQHEQAYVTESIRGPYSRCLDCGTEWTIR